MDNATVARPLDSAPVFLGWLDTDPRKSPEQKIREACERFEYKFGRPATTVLVHTSLDIAVEGLEIRQASYIRPNCFWAGIG